MVSAVIKYEVVGTRSGFSIEFEKPITPNESVFIYRLIVNALALWNASKDALSYLKDLNAEAERYWPVKELNSVISEIESPS